MRKFVIGTAESFKEFEGRNGHISGFTPFHGIEASCLDLEDAERQFLVSEGCGLDGGVIAHALSHVALWGLIAEGEEPALIFESGATLCCNFEEERERLTGLLPREWDIVVLGSNCQSVLQYQLDSGLMLTLAVASEQDHKKKQEAFSSQEVSSSLFKLVQTLSPCGYMVTPVGAKALIQSILPLQPVSVVLVCSGGSQVIAESLDVMLNCYYVRLRSFAAFPPLCLLPDVATISVNG